VRLRVLYSCESLCERTATEPGNMRARAACRCSLPGFDPQRWDPAAHPGAAAEAKALAAEMVAHAANRNIPLDFDLDRDGCPRGWMLARFPNSVQVYAGTRGMDSPLRMLPNRLRFRDPPPSTRLLEWVDYAEALEDGAISYYHEVVNRG
jgi:hypothetical protein